MPLDLRRDTDVPLADVLGDSGSRDGEAPAFAWVSNGAWKLAVSDPLPDDPSIDAKVRGHLSWGEPSRKFFDPVHGSGPGLAGVSTGIGSGAEGLLGGGGGSIGYSST